MRSRLSKFKHWVSIGLILSMGFGLLSSVDDRSIAFREVQADDVYPCEMVVTSNGETVEECKKKW